MYSGAYLLLGVQLIPNCVWYRTQCKCRPEVWEAPNEIIKVVHLTSCCPLASMKLTILLGQWHSPYPVAVNWACGRLDYGLYCSNAEGISVTTKTRTCFDYLFMRVDLLVEWLSVADFCNANLLALTLFAYKIRTNTSVSCRSDVNTGGLRTKATTRPPSRLNFPDMTPASHRVWKSCLSCYFDRQYLSRDAYGSFVLCRVFILRTCEYICSTRHCCVTLCTDILSADYYSEACSQTIVTPDNPLWYQCKGSPNTTLKMSKELSWRLCASIFTSIPLLSAASCSPVLPH